MFGLLFLCIQFIFLSFILCSFYAWIHVSLVFFCFVSIILFIHSLFFILCPLFCVELIIFLSTVLCLFYACGYSRECCLSCFFSSIILCSVYPIFVYLCLVFFIHYSVFSFCFFLQLLFWVHFMLRIIHMSCLFVFIHYYLLSFYPLLSVLSISYPLLSVLSILFSIIICLSIVNFILCSVYACGNSRVLPFHALGTWGSVSALFFPLLEWVMTATATHEGKMKPVLEKGIKSCLASLSKSVWCRKGLPCVIKV